MRQPNILYIMADQQRFDTLAALGNPHVYTPNLDRLVRRGVAFTNAYSTCPVCVPARYTVRTGCEPPTTRSFSNAGAAPSAGQAPSMEGRCGPYLARRMRELGYRTFGIGKFHSQPWDEDLGFDVHLHSEEMYGSEERRDRDDYAAWIAREHPPFAFLEGLMGERTEMYYMPQMSPLPAVLTVERWAADRAVEQLRRRRQPYFGFVSFVGPHPPLAPPVPFNRLYDPDRMPNPAGGRIETDHLDEQIPFMNHAIWAEDVGAPLARVLRARYYGEITYIDDCLGRILDAVEARPDADNTLIAFFSDHGDMLGDHHAWQKECFFEASCRVPFLVSWPARVRAGRRCGDLVCLTDLFGLATGAAGRPEQREGADVLGRLLGRRPPPRPRLLGYYGKPGTPRFKVMVRQGRWKYIFMANGGREQLFDLARDPGEVRNLARSSRGLACSLHAAAARACAVPGAADALDGRDRLRTFPFEARPPRRIYQFEGSRGATGFPAHPRDGLAAFAAWQAAHETRA